MSDYGNVLYADPKNKKYPIDTPKHIRAARAYFAMPRNKAQYTPAEQKAIQAKIDFAMDKLHAQQKVAGDTLAKCASGISKKYIDRIAFWEELKALLGGSKKSLDGINAQALKLYGKTNKTAGDHVFSQEDIDNLLSRSERDKVKAYDSFFTGSDPSRTRAAIADRLKNLMSKDDRRVGKYELSLIDKIKLSPKVYAKRVGVLGAAGAGAGIGALAGRMSAPKGFSKAHLAGAAAAGVLGGALIGNKSK